VPLVRFDVFTFDQETGELRKHGRPLKLQPQPTALLALLLDRAGSIVTRDRIQQALWPDGTVVDYDQSINFCVKRIRETLGDDAEKPRFVETVPRKGYRFLVPVEPVEVPAGEPNSAHPKSSRPGVRYRWLAAIVGALGLLALILSTGWISNRPVTAPVPRVKNPFQVTSAEGIENRPSWSPDGSRIAYDSDQSGNLDIWVSQADSGSAANFTADHPGSDSQPAWSPNGMRIAFVSAREGGGIYVMPAIGGVPSRISSKGTAESIASPQWSSDGEELAHLRREEEGGFIEIVSLRTRESRRIRIPGDAGNRFDLSWSPDGQFLAYVRAPNRDEGVSRIWSLRAGDDEAFPVSDGTSSDWSPVWSRDGRSLFFVSNRAGSMDLWQQRLAADGRTEGDPEAVTVGIGMQSVALTADGRKLAYSKGRSVANVFRVPVLADREATWEDAEQMTFDQAYIAMLDLSVDGRHLFVSSDRGGNADLWRVPVGGKDFTQLTTDRSQDWAPRLSPDGDRIAFYSYRTGNRSIWIMPAEGGQAVRLTDGSSANMFPSWSPDGRNIVFYSDRQGNVDVFVMPAEGTDVRQMTDDPASDYFPQWSPDGEWIVYTSFRADTDNRLWRVPAAGGTPEPMMRDSGHPPPALFRWSEDGKAIYFLRGDDNIWSLRLKDRSERRLTRLSGKAGSRGPYSLAVGGGYLYFTWKRDIGDIWTMDVTMEDEP
jgi:Tol biopolymer transport system component/DNA-binding winged helix-turn-helix (wHTH) protein